MSKTSCLKMEMDPGSKTGCQGSATHIGMNYFLQGDQVQGYVGLRIPGRY